MTLRVAHEVLHLDLTDPLRIARSDPGEGSTVTTVIVELRDDRFPDVVGIGEGYPERFYGETNIRRWHDGWLLFRMAAIAARRLKWV